MRTSQGHPFDDVYKIIAICRTKAVRLHNVHVLENYKNHTKMTWKEGKLKSHDKPSLCTAFKKNNSITDNHVISN